VLLFHGRYGTGKRAAARLLADTLGWPVLMLQTTELVRCEVSMTLGMRLAEREALLTGAFLCWCDADCVLPEWSSGTEDQGHAFVQALARGQVPTVLLLEKSWSRAAHSNNGLSSAWSCPKRQMSSGVTTGRPPCKGSLPASMRARFRGRALRAA